jgi:uracil-DNA glycosylase family protein
MARRPLSPVKPVPAAGRATARGLDGTAAALIPPGATLIQLRRIAAGCTACPLYINATQTVFGEGPEDAKLMLVGETPGDQEDLAGRPFVGPAGKLLDRCLAEAGIDRAETYVTNVVKHFKWEPRGKRRIHKKPNALEIRACKPWLEAEIDRVQPHVLVCLGATAAQALLGAQFRVSQSRGQIIASNRVPRILATHHPSALLRSQDDDREEKIAQLINDLKKAVAAMKAAA